MDTQPDSDLLTLLAVTHATQGVEHRLATLQATHETLHPIHLQRAEYHVRQALAALGYAAEQGERA